MRHTLPTARYRGYTLPELRRLIENCGLSAMRVYGHDEHFIPSVDLPVNGQESRFFYLSAMRAGSAEAGAGI